ncbi:MAG: hypothetical protein CMH55_07295 [Myxococcales bacterium]|nr:hypothetical protein [Myxococcales bacterium]|tara:strand:+ start:2703 stop:2936 length:234 start_codon:yes stop_codon:yes gene_type:complete
MIIDLCKTGILMAKAKDLPELLRGQGHQVNVHDCLDRCDTCDMGGILGRVDGIWIAAGKKDRFLGRLEEALEVLESD